MASGRSVEPTTYRICSRSRISEQRVTRGGPGCLHHRARPSPQIGENQMKRRQFQRSRAEDGSGAARTPRLPHQMRDAAAFARRSAHRKGDAAMDTVPAIEDQRHALQPICRAQRLSTGITYGAPGGGGRRDARHRQMQPDGAKPRRRPRRDALPSLPDYCAIGDGDPAWATRARWRLDAALTRCAPPAGVPLDTGAVSSLGARSGPSGQAS